MSVVSTSVSEYSPRSDIGSDDDVHHQIDEEYPMLRQRYALRSSNKNKRTYQQDHYNTKQCSNPKRYKQSVNSTLNQSLVSESTPVTSDDDDDINWNEDDVKDQVDNHTFQHLDQNVNVNQHQGAQQRLSMFAPELYAEDMGEESANNENDSNEPLNDEDLDVVFDERKEIEEETENYKKNQRYLRNRYAANKRLCLSKGVIFSNGKRVPTHSLGAIVEVPVDDEQEQKYKIALAKPWAEFPVNISKDRVQNLFSFGTLSFPCLEVLTFV